MSFISYYFHWGMDEVMKLDHTSRRQWCSEISEINKSLNPSKKSKEKMDTLHSFSPFSSPQDWFEAPFFVVCNKTVNSVA